MRFRIQLFIWVVFFFFDNGAVRKYKKIRIALLLEIFFFFASDGNQTRVYRVGDDYSTTEPPMLDFYCFNRSNKILLSILNFFYQSFESKSPKLCFILIKASNSAEYLSIFLLFWQWNCEKTKF